MDLEDFVQQTLVGIVKGIEAGRASTRGIAPMLEEPGDQDGVTGLIFTREDGNLQPVFMVEFDVAVSAEKKKGSDIGAGIRVLEFISGGAKRSSETHNATVSRIKFKVPLRLTPGGMKSAE